MSRHGAAVADGLSGRLTTAYDHGDLVIEQVGCGHVVAFRVCV